MYLEAARQILRITFTILLFITLPAVVFTLLTSKTPAILGIQSFTVLSGSMEPAIPVGSIVYTQPAPTYKAGDVIAFKQGKLTVTHRIVDTQIKGDQLLYQTKGDANEEADTKFISQSQIIGKNMYTVFNVGKLIYYMKTVEGFIVLLVLPTLLFIGVELWGMKKEFEQEIRKKVIKEIHMRQNGLLSS